MRLMGAEVHRHAGRENEPRPAQFTVIRHGRTSWNVEGRNQGNVDTDILPDLIEGYLEDLGARQLDQPDYLLVSKLRRSSQTAQALQTFNGWRGIPVITDERLNERRWGVAEGEKYDVAYAKALDDPLAHELFPEMQSIADVKRLWDTKDFKITGGESLVEVKRRVMPALIEVSSEHPGAKIFMISHAGVLLSLGLNPHKISYFSLQQVNEIPTIIPSPV